MADVRVVGVDGVRERWIAAALQLDPTGNDLPRCEWFIGSAAQVLALAEVDDVRGIGIDIPIGLAATCTRAADDEARRLLGVAAGSIFTTAPAPAFAVARRDGTDRTTRVRAEAAARAVGAGGISTQSWMITSKVLEVEDAVRALGAAEERVVEVHPETAFAVMARHFARPAPASKRTAAGVAQRVQLLGQTLPGLDIVGALAAVPAKGPARDRIPVDDALDALAAACSALRHCYGAAIVLGRGSDAVWTDGTPAPGRAVIVV